MKTVVGLLIVLGLLALSAVMVARHWVLGVLVLVAGAYTVPIIIARIHREYGAEARRRRPGER